MRTFQRILLAAASASIASLGAGAALAQKDIQPKLPNVLLLVDNSGSMEYLMDPPGKLPGDSSTTNTACDGSTNRSARNRWANLVTALTGTISDADFSCRKVTRSGAAFTGEYGTGTYDANYYLPFHRIYSNNCAYGAGQMPTTLPWNWWQLPSATGGKDFTYRNTAGGAVPSCTFTQGGDGLLDAFRSLVRFGMMTLDTFPDPGTGSTPTGTPASATADLATGNQGMWSYFRNWIAGPPVMPGVSGSGVNALRPGAGNPAGCATPSFFEVGARNASAPPWEGRMVPFGDWNDDGNVPNINDQIQMELLTLRPYGATPVAGLLDDAKEFLFNDTTTVPGQTYRFGPSDDQYWKFGCRKTFVILLSDGQPNMDMRSPASGVSGCDTTLASPFPGVCPYETADQIATELRTSPPTPSQSVYTFVVGFTISDFNRMSPVPSVPSAATKCEDLDVSVSGSDCVNPPPELRACCNLQKIAYAGGTSHAYFADTSNKLKQALAAILSQIIAGTTDRTWPVYAPGGNRQAQGSNFAGNPTASYQFAASFTVNAPPIAGPSAVDSLVPGLWKGRLLRERTSCPQPGNTPTPQPINITNGDDFAYNLDNSDTSHPRKIFTAIGNKDGNKIYSERTIRPHNTVNDGLGLYKTSTTAPGAPSSDTTFTSDMASYPEAFDLSNGPCHAAFGNSANTSDCATYITRWEVGLNNPSLPNTVPRHTRDWHNCLVNCPSPIGCPCSKMGAIFHSTPTVVGPPRDFLRDETYTNYANGSFGAYGSTGNIAQQPTVLYTATMDGQLHAFKVQANDPADTQTTDQPQNNELWSFIPPAVLKRLLPNYNTGGVSLLDGVPVVADVPGTAYTASETPVLTRIATTTAQWHRILVSGGGTAGGFYYALDVTNPNTPRFLWQLSTDDKGDPMFGGTTPTPAIAIVNARIDGVTQQIPVAILSGGGTGSTVSHCSNSLKAIPAADSLVSLADSTNPHLLTGVLSSPPDLRCWNMKKNSNRSTGNALYVVRLDNGQVLAAFLGQKYRGAPDDDGGPDDGDDDDHHGHHGNHGGIDVTHDAVPFRAPITGVPVPFPGQLGEVSDRVYVGDADGLLWRLDMSNPDLTTWKVKLAWDPYVDDTTNNNGSTREGISITPVVSRDAIGNPVLIVATGDQDNFSRQPRTNHIWSLTEHPTTKAVSPNWHIAMPQFGARVTGPMALFNSTLYFATFLPQAPGGNPCSDGFASVWAVDFVRRGTSAASGPVPAGLTPVMGVWPLPMFPTTGSGTVYGLDASDRTVIMGISVGESPTCETQISMPDPYFGSHTALSGVSSSNYQVMWQTGAGLGLSTSNTAVKSNPNIPGVQFIQPPPPGQGTRIDSWASIVD